MNIQRKNSAHHFRIQSERKQTLVSSMPTFQKNLVVRYCILNQIRFLILCLQRSDSCL